MGRLTTHVLDTMRGVPAAGMTVELFRLDGDDRRAIQRTVTNLDGRCDQPLLEGNALTVDRYELVFHVGAYFDGLGGVSDPPFLDEVPVRFALADAGGNYHVPLLVTPWSYATYRGS